jgi:hypothetical protein
VSVIGYSNATRGTQRLASGTVWRGARFQVTEDRG